MRYCTGTRSKPQSKKAWIAAGLMTVLGGSTAKAEAGSLNCQFPPGLAVRSIANNRVVWKDGTPDTRVYVSRITADGPLELGGVVDSQQSLYGAATPSGNVTIAVYGPSIIAKVASQGRCTGMETFRNQPIVPPRTPSGFENLMAITF